MKRNILERIRCEIEWDQPRRIEIFGNRRYRDYCIRGYLNMLDGSYFPSSDDDDFKPYKPHLASINYWFVITVLVNDRYQKRIRRDRNRRDFRFWQDKEWVPEPMFETTNPKEYVEMKRRKLLIQLKKWGRPQKSVDKWTLDVFRDETIMLSLDEAGVKDSKYLSEAIGSKKDIIVLDMDFFLAETEPRGFYMNKDYLTKLYAVPAFFYPLRNTRSEMNALANWFDDLFDVLDLEADYHYLRKTEYARILESTGKLAYKWITRKSISTRDLKLLNRLKERMGDRTYPLTNFCWKFFDDLVGDLTTQKQITRCEFCGDFFVYQRRWPTKKFCRLRFEGKDCGKRYNNRADYERHLEERKLKAGDYQRKKRALKKEQDRLKAEKKKEQNRKYQRDYRATLKKYGVKK